MSFVLPNDPSIADRMIQSKMLVVEAADSFYSDAGGNTTIAIGDTSISRILLAMKFNTDAAEAADIVRLNNADIDLSSGDIVITGEVLAAGDSYLLIFV